MSYIWSLLMRYMREYEGYIHSDNCAKNRLSITPTHVHKNL